MFQTTNQNSDDFLFYIKWEDRLMEWYWTATAFSLESLSPPTVGSAIALVSCLQPWW